MLRFSCLMVFLMTASARGDDPKPAPVSPIRGMIAATQAVVDRGRVDRGREHEKITSEPISDAEKLPKYEAATDRYHSAITPTIIDLLEAASKRPDDPTSVEALRFILINARGLTTGQVDRALALLKRDHVRDSNISIALAPLWIHHDKPEAIALLRAVAADNPSRTERGRGWYVLGYTLRLRLERVKRALRNSPDQPLPPHLAGSDPVALRAEAEAAYDRCLSEFADVPAFEDPSDPTSIGKTVGDFARGELFEMRRLQVGMEAPEITGLDIDGKSIRLGDHRGKVVVLVFSGEWCGPCKQAAKHFRDMLKPEAQKTSPCVILEVNTDETREAVRKAIDVGDITWPCWFDGSTAGPITMTWGVSSFPTIYVLDAQGIIRAKDIRGEATAAAVAKILAADAPGNQP